VANVEGTASEQQADLVFEGGGVKGIGLAGAYRELYDSGYRPGCVAGTSAGAITAALVAVGYSGAELQQVALHEMDFKKFEDPTFLDHFGVAGDIAEFLKSRGMHSGKYFLGWIREQLQAKGKTQFGHLRDPNPSAENRTYKLQVIASDISAQSMIVLPRDAQQLGLGDPDELEIAQAVRMSMSIPVFFEPVVQRDGHGQEHTIVDGGLLSNFPIWLFDSAPGVRPSCPTFGMLLVAPNQAAPLIQNPPAGAQLGPVTSPIEFAKAIADTMMEAHDRFYVEQANFARTIPIPTLGVKTTEFDIAPERAQELFNSGGEAAKSFLGSWNFDAYIERFRSGPAPSRRSTVLGGGQ
jgi:NTE family protein